MESNHSRRLSYVPSQPAMIPSSRSMLTCDKRLRLDTWNMSGPQENVFGNQCSTFDSSRDHPQGIHRSTTPGATGSVPVHIGTGTSVARGEDRIKDTIPMPTFARRPSTMSPLLPVEIPQNSKVGQQRQQISELEFDKCPDPHSTFLCWKIKKIQQPRDYLFCFSIGGFVMDQRIMDGRFIGRITILAINCRKNFPDFEMLDAKIASALNLNKIIQNSHFKKKDSLEEQKAQKEDRFLRGKQIAFMIYDYFQVTGAHDTVLDCADVFSVTLRDDNVLEFDTRWDKVLLSMTKIPPDDVLESLYKLRIRECDRLKTALELYGMEIHQKISMPNYQNFLKRW